MSLSNLVGLLQRYENGATADSTNAAQDFAHVAGNAPQSHVSAGLADAFRSDQTPPFPQMLGTLFSNSNGPQRAGILNELLASLGPAAGSSILGGLLGGGSQVTPEQAQQLPPERVQQLAEQAQERDPSIIERASSFYAQHPTVIQSLGAGALALMMSHMSRKL